MPHDSQKPTPTTTKRSWILLIIVVGLLGVLVGLPYIVLRPAMPRSELRRLAIGKTRDDVRSVLGNPQGSQEGPVWIYSRFGNPGWFEVHFDEVERLAFVNDESVLP